MRKQSLDFLKKLLNTPSPSGFEEEIQKLCKRYASQYVDRVYKDVHGNQFHVKNEKAKLRVMLAGHVDEIALQLNYLDDFGYFSFLPIGGIDASVLDGQRVIVEGKKGPVQGVIGRRAIHLTDQPERGKPLKLHEMWIDIGAKDKADAQKMANIGDTAVMDASFKEMANGRAVARGFDNRIGAFVVLEAMRLLANKKIDVGVYCVTTVQEEIGLRGATTGAYGVEPHVGIAVDVGHATDFPNCDYRKYGQFALNAGPILHRGANINPVVGEGLMKVAKHKKIPYQLEATPRGTGTDANAMQVSRGGVATALISVPNRYMHSPVEMIALDDAENAAKLIAEWIAALKPGSKFIP